MGRRWIRESIRSMVFWQRKLRRKDLQNMAEPGLSSVVLSAAGSWILWDVMERVRLPEVWAREARLLRFAKSTS